MNKIHSILLNIFAIAAILLTAASCQKGNEIFSTDEELADIFSFSVTREHVARPETKSNIAKFVDENGNPAPFDIILIEEQSTPDMVTKGIPVEDVETFVSLIDSFKVWGYDNKTPITKKQNYPYDLSGQKVKFYCDNSYCPADNDGKYLNYYPLVLKNGAEKAHFYALAPFTPAGTISDLTCSYDYLRFTYTMPAPNATDMRDAEAQQEILVGIQDGSVTKSEIPMTFRLPLARIRFMVGDITKNVKIKAISLKNIVSKGRYRINSNGTSVWDQYNSTTKNYTQLFDFDLTTGTAKSTDINDGMLTKTFFVIPYNYTQGEAAIYITYQDEYGDHEVSYSIKGQDWKEGYTYTFTISNFETNELIIDFPKYTNYGGKSFTHVNTAFNDSIHCVYTQETGQYEKLNIPIRNCVPGTWYALSFHENIYNTNGTKCYNDCGLYGCRVDDTELKSLARHDMLSWYYDNPIDSKTSTRYIWVCDEELWGNKPYTHPTSAESPATILFKATSETMYWIWDCSKLSDGAPIDVTIYFDAITAIPIPSDPSVDFLNSAHYNFRHGQNDDENNGYSSYKTNATYNSMELHFRPRGAYGRLNIPLINLEVGHKYKLSFTIEKTKGGKSTDTNKYFGYLVSNTQNTTNTKYTPTEDFQNKSELAANSAFTFTEDYEFTATAATMYWIWEMNIFPSNTLNEMFFKDVAITDITPLPI